MKFLFFTLSNTWRKNLSNDKVVLIRSIFLAHNISLSVIIDLHNTADVLNPEYDPQLYYILELDNNRINQLLME